MVREPVWSTWARYKVDVNEAVVTQFANEILDNGFKGQFELDDDWEECYGALTFNTNANKFPNIKKLTDSLHEKGFRVTLWVHPFINVGCEKYFNDAKSKGRLVADQNGDVRTEWWNSKRGEAGYIDFTKTETANWFYDHLKALQTSAGIDSYKFDAGESSWTPPDPKLNSTSKQPVHKIVADYVRTCARFGSLVEVRSGQSTQNLPVFVRMIDKDTEWTLNNGLPTLITTLLQVDLELLRCRFDATMKCFHYSWIWSATGWCYPIWLAATATTGTRQTRKSSCDGFRRTRSCQAFSSRTFRGITVPRFVQLLIRIHSLWLHCESHSRLLIGFGLMVHVMVWGNSQPDTHPNTSFNNSNSGTSRIQH